MERQQHCFNDSTTIGDSDRLQKSAKSLHWVKQIMSISQVSTQKYRSAHFDPF